MNVARVKAALARYERLLDKTCDEDGVRVQIAQIAALLDDMSPREQVAYYAGAQRLRVAWREKQDA